MALRAICSAPRNTSIAALHRLLQVEPIHFRAKELNILWASRLHNSSDRSIPAVRVWRGALRSEPVPGSTCLPQLARSNPLASRPDANWLELPLAQPLPVTIPPPQQERPPRALAPSLRKSLRKESIVALGGNAESIASTIQVEPGDPVCPYLQAGALDRRM